MKFLPLTLLLIFISCQDNSKKIQGIWNSSGGSVGGNMTNSNGYLGSTLVFRNDSVYIYEGQFFLRSRSKYLIRGDSIEFLQVGNPKYLLKIEGDELNLYGYNTIRGCEFREDLNFMRDYSEFSQESMLIQDTINHYELTFGSWCYTGNGRLEKYIPAENRQIPINLNDSIGTHYFPRELDLNAANVEMKNNLEFTFDSTLLKISDYNGHFLVVLKETKDTNYFMQYVLCEDRELWLRK